MTLSELIPEIYFIAPPAKRQKSHGKIGLCKISPYQGQLVVSWDRGCPIFDANLAAARGLKAQNLGTYRPDHGGWVFAAHAVAQVFEAFPTLEATPEVLALLDSPPPAPEVSRQLHGTICWNPQAKQFQVAFGGGFNVPRDAFARYVDAARGIRAGIPGCRGWQGSSKSWLFCRQAAARIALAFPAEYFEHPPELVEAAKACPKPAPQQTREQANQEAQDAGGPDTLATLLLATAEAVLATL